MKRVNTIKKCRISDLHRLALLAGRATNPVPQAYLWVGLYGKDSVLVAERRVALTDSLPAGEWQQLPAKLYADSAGYVEVQLRDESPQAAYFDDLLVRVIKANGIQEHHYDPWGLPLVGIQTRPADRLERRQFNGKPHVEDFGLHWNNHGARYYDFNGRWLGVDPLAAKYPSVSPYVFGMNNPVRFFDPDGREVVDARGVAVRMVNGVGVYRGNDKGMRSYVDAMNKTPMSRETLGAMVKHKTITEITISQDRGPIDKATGREAQGLTTHKSGLLGDKAFTTLYLGAYENQQTDNGPAGSKNEYKGASAEEFINGVGTHEGWHVLTDQEVTDKVTEEAASSAKTADDFKAIDSKVADAIEVIPDEKEGVTRSQYKQGQP